MKKFMQRVFALLIAVIMVSFGGKEAISFLLIGTYAASNVCYENFYSSTYSGDPGQYMANIALAQSSRTGSSLGYTDNWCAFFVSDCARIAGQEAAIPANGNVLGLYNALISAGGTLIYSGRDGSGSLSNSRIGDICIIDTTTGSNTSRDHVEIVYSVSGSSVSTIGGNSYSGSAPSPNTVYTRYVAKHNPQNSSRIVYIVRPNYVNSINLVSVPEGVYVFHCVRNPDRVLDIQYDSKERGANIQLYNNWYNQVQKFRVVNMGDYYCIQSVYSGMWLDIANKDGSYSVSGCNIQLWDTNTSTEQKWVFEDAGDGNVYIHSLYGMYLDTGGPTDNNTNIQTWPFDGSTSQQWKLELTSPYGRKDVADGIYTFHNYRNQNRVLDIMYDSTEIRANIQLYDDLNNSVQRFRVTKVLDDTNSFYYVIQSVYSGYWLDIASPFTTSGCNVQLWQDHSSPEQKWIFEDAGNGKVLIRSLYGTYVDLENGKTDNSTNVQTFNYDGSTSMEWVMHRVYSVNYNANGGTGAPAEQAKQSDISITLSSAKPSKPGYTFNGWNTKADGSGTNYAPGGTYSGNADVTLYANWTVAEVPAVSSNKNTYRVGETAAFSFSAPNANSLHFYIYKDNVLYFQGQYAPTATYSRTLYETETGHYTYYIVAHYDGQDVTSAVKSFDVDGNYTIDLNAYIDGEYYYGSHSAGLVDVYINGELSQADVSDYCKTFPDGTGYEIKNIRPAIGYYYGGSTVPTSGVINHEDVNIIVCFNTSSSTLKVDPNGGVWNGSSAVQSFTQNYNTTLAVPVPVREGYTFIGWDRTGEHGSMTSLNEAAEYVFGALNGTEDTIKAKWAISCTVTLDPNGGVCGIPAITAYYGEHYGVLPVPTRDGFAFDGWFTADGEPVTESTVVALAEDHTLYAHWTADETAVELTPKEGSTAVLDRERGFIYGLDFDLTETTLCEQYLDVSAGGHLVCSSPTIGTGTVVYLVDDATGDTLESFTVVLFGDLNGDGLLNSSDVTALRSINARLTEYDDGSPFLLAADVTHDGIVNTSDITFIRTVNARMSEIEQTV